MFPLQQSNDDLLFHIFSDSPNKHKIPQDLTKGHASLEHNHLLPIIGDGLRQNRRRKASHILRMDDTTTTTNCDKHNKKKKLHREIERQRRQDMASLCSSLRSLLPHHYIKGKRSMSDHMNEAVNYIKNQEKKVKELEAKRDELKRVSNLAAVASASSSSSSSSSGCFIIRPGLMGVEIMFRSGGVGEEQGLPLSRVLALLQDEGLPVVSCVSAKSEASLLHTIQTEVSDPTSINLSGLQQKLSKLQS